MVGQAFGEWVSEQIEARNERLAEERDLMIQMDPAVYEAFQKSTAVSCKLHHDSSYEINFLTYLLLF